MQMFARHLCTRHIRGYGAALSWRHRQPPAGRGPLTARAFDISALELDAPEIDGDLRSVQTELGATFRADGVALTYSNAQQAVEAPESGVALVDRSHWPRLILQGRDRGPLLQKYSTADLTGLQPGQGCDTVLVDADGAAVDLVTALLSEKHTTLVISPGNAERVRTWVQQQCQDGDLKVKVLDVSERTRMVSLVGPESAAVLAELTGSEQQEPVPGLGNAYASHTLLGLSGTPLQVFVGCGLPVPGFTLICDESIAGELFSLLAVKGSILMGEDEWEVSRVLAGRPAVPSELGPGFSPLEAGLYHAVNLRKVIAYDGLHRLAGAESAGHAQELWGVSLEAPATPGATMTVAASGDHLGIISSVVAPPTGQPFALAYVATCDGDGNRLALQAGMPVRVAGAPAALADIPFASRGFLKDLVPGAAASDVVLGPGAETMAREAALAAQQAAAEAQAEVQARAVRVQETADKLAAWQANQLQGRS